MIYLTKTKKIFFFCQNTEIDSPQQRNQKTQFFTIFSTFGGPFSDTPCRPQDLDWIVPKEYETNSRILEKLQKLDLNLYQDDTIFMLYYTHPRDILQVFTIQKLYGNGWRYHKQLKRWLKRHDDQKETIFDVKNS